MAVTPDASGPGGRSFVGGRLAGRGGFRSSVALRVLTLATGAVDAIGFMALGGVFSSVMTANLALLGIGVGSLHPELTRHALVALGGYVCGVLVGSAITAGRARRAKRRPSGESLALMVELLMLCGFLAGWVAVDGRPEGPARSVLLAVAALAMGCQSGTVRVAVAANVSTTYLTGALTGLLTDLATKGKFPWRGLVLIAALLVGAGLGACLLTWARIVAPVLPVALLAAVTLYTFRSPGQERRRGEKA